MLVSSTATGAVIFLAVVSLIDKASSKKELYDDPLDYDENKSSLEILNVNSQCIADVTTKHFVKIEKGCNIELDCGSSVIYNVTVTAWLCKNSACGGLTHELLTSSKNCLWENRCNVTYVPGPILFPFSTCFGEEPSSIELSFLCMTPENSIHDLIKTHQVIESQHGALVAEKSTESNEGKRRYRAVVRPPKSMTGVQGVYLEVKRANITNGGTVCIVGSHTNFSIVNNDIFTKELNGSSFEFNVYRENVPPSFYVTFQWCNKFKRANGGGCQNGSRNIEVPIFDVMKENTSKAMYGILRSHPRYPWNYRRPLQSRSDIKEWTSFYHKLEPLYTGLDLVIQIVSFDLPARDTLKIMWGESSNNLIKGSGEPRRCLKCTSLGVNFTVQHGDLPTKSGFLIRYEWLENSKQDAFSKKSIIYDKKYKKGNVVRSSTSQKPCRKPHINIKKSDKNSKNKSSIGSKNGNRRKQRLREEKPVNRNKKRS